MQSNRGKQGRWENGSSRGNLVPYYVSSERPWNMDRHESKQALPCWGLEGLGTHRNAGCKKSLGCLEESSHRKKLTGISILRKSMPEGFVWKTIMYFVCACVCVYPHIQRNVVRNWGILACYNCFHSIPHCYCIYLYTTSTWGFWDG